MTRLYNWLNSWATTLRIMIFERDTYKTILGQSEDDWSEDDRWAHLTDDYRNY